MNAIKFNQTMQLADGRTLGFAEDEGHMTLFYRHTQEILLSASGSV